MTSAVPVLTQAEMSVWADPVSAPGLPEPMLQVPPLLQGEVVKAHFVNKLETDLVMPSPAKMEEPYSTPVNKY